MIRSEDEKVLIGERGFKIQQSSGWPNRSKQSLPVNTSRLFCTNNSEYYASLISLDSETDNQPNIPLACIVFSH